MLHAKLHARLRKLVVAAAVVEKRRIRTKLPKDERDKKVAAHKAAHEAKKAGGGGGGVGKKKNKDNKAHRILSRLNSTQVLRLFLDDNLLKVGKALCKAVSGLLLAR